MIINCMVWGLVVRGHWRRGATLRAGRPGWRRRFMVIIMMMLVWMLIMATIIMTGARGGPAASEDPLPKKKDIRIK